MPTSRSFPGLPLRLGSADIFLETRFFRVFAVNTYILLQKVIENYNTLHAT